MKKYFIYQDEKSQKFWNIEKTPQGVVVSYGRIGTTGQTKEKNFSTEEEIDKEINKLIKEKEKKGYTETNELDLSLAKDEAKRFVLSHDEIWEHSKGVEDLVKKMEKDKLSTYKSITVGLWGEAYEDGCQPILDYITNNPETFKNLETLFIGDMDVEDCEISWIIQGNYTEIFKTLPNLKKIKIKGSQDLVLSPINHENLEHLEIICGGLGKDVLNDIANSNLPNLKTLILYIGVEDYGFDGDISNIKLMLKEDLFPSLKNLELVNSELQNEIVKEVLNSSILPRLESVSFSYGVLSDEGGELLLNNADKLTHLNQITIEYHYLSEEMVKNLKKKFINIKISDEQDDEGDEDYRYPMLTE